MKSINMRRRQKQRFEKDRDLNTSSSSDENGSERPRSISASSNQSTSETGHRRRRRRRKRRTSGAKQKLSFIKTKALNIERALLEIKDDDYDNDATNDCSSTPAAAGRLCMNESPMKKGKNRLKEIAITEAGLLNDDFRRKVWPRLLDIDMVETSVVPSDEIVKSNKNYHQVLMDVNRSLKRFPPGIKEEDRPELQDQLTRLIIRILSQHPDLHYYQGYHDVAITFLLVVGEEMAFNILEKLSNGPWLREFMEPTMEKTTYLLNYMYPLMKKVDPLLFDFLESSEVGTIFALPWLITWFAHVLPDYEDVVRLYDFFLAQPPMMPIYLATSILLHRSEDVRKVECDMASVHGILSSIPLDCPPFELLLQKATNLYSDFPPNCIEKDVELRMKEIQENLLLPRQHRHDVSSDNSVIPSSDSSSSGRGMLIKKIIFVAAPIFVGVFLYRFSEFRSYW